MSEKGMLAELREDAMGAGIDIVMPDIVKMVKPFVKPAHKQLAMALGADDAMFLIRKVLVCEDTIFLKNGNTLKKNIQKFESESITYKDYDNSGAEIFVALNRSEIKGIELSEEKQAIELKQQIEELRAKEPFHIDIIPLEKKRNLLGTVYFYVVESKTIEQFELTAPPKVEFPITNPETLITGLITGELYKIDKTL